MFRIMSRLYGLKGIQKGELSDLTEAVVVEELDRREAKLRIGCLP